MRSSDLITVPLRISIDPSKILDGMSERRVNLVYLGCAFVDEPESETLEYIVDQLSRQPESAWFAEFLQAVKSLQSKESEGFASHVGEMIRLTDERSHVQWACDVFADRIQSSSINGTFDWEASAYELMEASNHMSLVLDSEITVLFRRVCEKCAPSDDPGEFLRIIWSMDMALYLMMQMEVDIRVVTYVMKKELEFLSGFNDMDHDGIDSSAVETMTVHRRYLEAVYPEYENGIVFSRRRPRDVECVVEALNESTQARIGYESDPSDEKLSDCISSVKKFIVALSLQRCCPSECSFHQVL